MLGIYVHIYTKYEDSLSNPVTMRAVHRRQSMIVMALVDKRNEPKKGPVYTLGPA